MLQNRPGQPAQGSVIPFLGRAFSMKRIRKAPVHTLADVQLKLARAREEYRDALVLQRKAAELIRGSEKARNPQALDALSHTVALAARRYERTLRAFIAEATHNSRTRAS